jgi:FHA domain-containing protein
MALLRIDPVVAPSRHQARDIIEAVVANMRKNLETLKYSTLAPSCYTVYLHPSEYERLVGIIPILQEQTTRALTDELDQLNTRSPIQRWLRRFVSDSEPEVRNAASEWQVEFLADPDGDLGEGDVLVDSELVLPGRPDLSIGERTRKITTLHSGRRTTTREQTVNRSPSSSPARVLGQIEYDDDSGHHLCDLIKDSFTIGRGGIAYPVDIRIVSSPDVSREHVRIRRDAKTDRFFLIDLSSLGTTLNGRYVPKGYDEIDGTKRENGSETALSDVATIGLADTIFLQFRKS